MSSQIKPFKIKIENTAPQSFEWNFKIKCDRMQNMYTYDNENP